MDKSLFNFHDLILLLTAFECLAIVIFMLKTSKVKSLAVIFISAFFLVRFTISIHELVLWGSTFRHWVLSISPNLFFIFDFSYCLDGPLLYFYARSLTHPKIALKRVHLLHFIPALLLVGYITLTFYLLPVAQKEILVRDYSFADFDFVLVDSLVKLSRLIYVALAFNLLSRWVKKENAKAVTVQSWLPHVVRAFFIILSLELLLSLIKVYHALFTLDYYYMVEIIGLSDYYLLFALVNVVIFLSVSQVASHEVIKPKPVPKEPINMEHVKKLQAAMEDKKLYLNHHLSIERLSEKLDIPLKELSSTINRHYHVNFYEFINNYRIEEAKRMLCSPEHSERSITDIFFDAGFNSKSVYNTLFKKKYNQTPSQYRKKVEQQASTQESA